MDPIADDTPITFEPIDQAATAPDLASWLSTHFPNSIAALARPPEPSPLPTIEW